MDRERYLLSMFTPDTCRVPKNKCHSALYLETCKWASGPLRSYCRKRKRRRTSKVRVYI